MSRSLKLAPAPRTLIAVHLPQDVVRAGKVLALKRGVPFTRIVFWALRRYVWEAAEVEAQQPTEGGDS